MILALAGPVDLLAAITLLLAALVLVIAGGSRVDGTSATEIDHRHGADQARREVGP